MEPVLCNKHYTEHLTRLSTVYSSLCIWGQQRGCLHSSRYRPKSLSTLAGDPLELGRCLDHFTEGSIGARK